MVGCASKVKKMPNKQLTPFGVRRLVAALLVRGAHNARQRGLREYQSGDKSPHSKEASYKNLSYKNLANWSERCLRRSSHVSGFFTSLIPALGAKRHRF